MELFDSKPTQKGRPYYKVIDGQRFDLALLQQVDTYISTASGNALSEAEVRAIGEAIHDSNRITQIEKNTLEYIRSNYPLSAKAAKWWDENIKISDNLQQRIFLLKSRHHIPGLSIEFDQKERFRQTNIPSNKLGFEEALSKAILCLLNDETSAETPFNLVKELFPTPSETNPNSASMEQIEARLQVFFNTGKLGLLPEYDVNDPESWDKLPYNIPENRETVEDNWIFVLSLPDLSDHIYWAIVDRTGEKPAFAYGFN
jgi:hypothetical protein